jgi:hypothetical protein
MARFFLLLIHSLSRDPRTLYVDPTLDGDCFTSACGMKTAALVVRVADSVYFPPTVIRPTSYPSEFSDLFMQLTLMNTTVISRGTTIDGRFLGADMLWQITSSAVFTWTVLHNWTFRYFSKPIAVREYAWSTSPYVIFRDCTFEDSFADLFAMRGGTLIFENCVFRNVSGRPLKAISDVHADFVECTFEGCAGLFVSGSDASFTNCRFTRMGGQRGGAIHSMRSTLFVDHCVFTNCEAAVNGGAIYVRESAAAFESEIRNSCFIANTAKANGTDVFAYQSHLEVRHNCFGGEEGVVNMMGDVAMENITYDRQCLGCLTGPPAEVLENDYSPVDTNKWYQFDDLKSGTTAIIDDEDDL